MKEVISHIMEDGWNIAVRKMELETILQERTTPFTILQNTWRTWAADPFLFDYNENVYVFAELYDYITRRGSIGYTKHIKDNKWSKWKIAINEPFHMSYPYIFQYENEIYMLPETSASHELRLYRATQFPDKWECARIIAENVMWVDTTFFLDGNKMYAITTDVSDESNHKDYLLQFDNEFNIVDKKMIDEKHTELSRSGGKFFYSNHVWHRVSQDCTFHYGAGLIFSKFNPSEVVDGMGQIIIHLFPKDIELNENKKWIGLHTYNGLEGYEVIDIERQHFNIWGVLSRVLIKIKRFKNGR